MLKCIRAGLLQELRCDVVTKEITVYGGEQGWNEFWDRVMFVYSELLVQEIQTLIERMNLYQTGDYYRGVIAGKKVVGNEIHLDNAVYYAGYLEYGTYDYFKKYGGSSFPKTTSLKKKEMTAQMRVNAPAGMQPFATYRRVLYNPEVTQRLLSRAIMIASK